MVNVPAKQIQSVESAVELCEADKLLQSIGLLGHKAELQELAGKTWTIEVLSFLDADDLEETTLTTKEKKTLVTKLKNAKKPDKATTTN